MATVNIGKNYLGDCDKLKAYANAITLLNVDKFILTNSDLIAKKLIRIRLRISTRIPPEYTRNARRVLVTMHKQSALPLRQRVGGSGRPRGGIRRRLVGGGRRQPLPCAERMVECSPDACGLPEGREVVGVDNQGLEGEDSDSDASDGEDSDVTTDGNVLALSTDHKNDKSNFGDISVTNSTDIHFGNKTFYQGPVTIKQFVYATATDDDASDLKDGHAKKPGELTDCQLKILSTEANAKERIVQIPNGFANCAEGPLKVKVPLRVYALSATLVLSVVVAVVTVAVVLVLTSKTNAPGGASSLKNFGDGLDHNPPNANYAFNLSGKLRVLTRKQWLAQPTAEPPAPLELPVPYVIISHTASENCSSQSECTFIVRTVQTFHIDSLKWNDIGYNFLVGGDGYAYEGRGWDSVGAHTFGYNVCSIGISFIGTFVNRHPPPRQMLAARQLIEEGVRMGKIRKDYLLIGHRQASATESPGQALYDDITHLPHWTETPLGCDGARKPSGK